VLPRPCKHRVARGDLAAPLAEELDDTHPLLRLSGSRCSALCNAGSIGPSARYDTVSGVKYFADAVPRLIPCSLVGIHTKSDLILNNYPLLSVS
jgi:hypothetical protein